MSKRVANKKGGGTRTAKAGRAGQAMSAEPQGSEYKVTVTDPDAAFEFLVKFAESNPDDALARIIKKKLGRFANDMAQKIYEETGVVAPGVISVHVLQPFFVPLEAPPPPGCGPPRCGLMDSALALFRRGAEFGDGGRRGMIGTLSLMIAEKANSLPARDLDQLEPVIALVRGLQDVGNGIQHQALKASALSGNRDQQYVVDFKARCLVLARALRERGLAQSNANADEIVINGVKEIASLLDLRLSLPKPATPERRAKKSTLENWRRDLRRQHDPAPPAQSLPSLVDHYSELLSERASYATSASVQRLLNMVLLEIMPPMSAQHLAHLASARTYPPL